MAREYAAGDVALMRIPISVFRMDVTWCLRRVIARCRNRSYAFQNRFVGRYLIYGTGSGWGSPKENVEKWNLFLVDWAR